MFFDDKDSLTLYYEDENKEEKMAGKLAVKSRFMFNIHEAILAEDDFR